MEVNIYSFLMEELQEFLLKSYSLPKYRATQIFEWLYKGIQSYQDITNLPSSLRTQLSQDLKFPQMQIVRKQESNDGTRKYLLKCPFDENLLEVVVMSYKFGYSACISTQIGCAMHCKFCASGETGLVRNLSAGEMVLQVLTVQNAIQQRISNIVLMGMGEPLDNFSETMKFLELVHHPKGLNMGFRHITLSTCGVVPKIYDLAEYNYPITLAISLHAPNNDLRSSLMPINRKYPLESLLKACTYYQHHTKRRITFEYALIQGVNDTLGDAQQLQTLINSIMCHVNLIPINPTNYNHQGPSKAKIYDFQKYLEDHHIPCTIRRQMGVDIDAACGQLRKRYQS